MQSRVTARHLGMMHGRSNVMRALLPAFAKLPSPEILEKLHFLAPAGLVKRLSESRHLRAHHTPCDAPEPRRFEYQLSGGG